LAKIIVKVSFSLKPPDSDNSRNQGTFNGILTDFDFAERYCEEAEGEKGNKFVDDRGEAGRKFYISNKNLV
jgi:hypothetical protein